MATAVRCPDCGAMVPAGGTQCPQCHRVFPETPATPPPPVAVIAHRPPATSLQIFSRLVWGIALGVLGLSATDGVISFQAAQSAPQQAAAAAWGCFQLVAAYTIARAIHETLTA